MLTGDAFIQSAQHLLLCLYVHYRCCVCMYSAGVAVFNREVQALFCWCVNIYTMGVMLICTAQLLL